MMPGDCDPNGGWSIEAGPLIESKNPKLLIINRWFLYIADAASMTSVNIFKRLRLFFWTSPFSPNVIRLAFVRWLGHAPNMSNVMRIPWPSALARGLIR
jgi:hypothetical protein